MFFIACAVCCAYLIKRCAFFFFSQLSRRTVNRKNWDAINWYMVFHFLFFAYIVIVGFVYVECGVVLVCHLERVPFWKLQITFVFEWDTCVGRILNFNQRPRNLRPKLQENKLNAKMSSKKTKWIPFVRKCFPHLDI